VIEYEVYADNELVGRVYMDSPNDRIKQNARDTIEHKFPHVTITFKCGGDYFYKFVPEAK
jgi:hypothetical protein